jgi:hypothetical protein
MREKKQKPWPASLAEDRSTAPFIENKREKGRKEREDEETVKEVVGMRL